MKRVVGLLLVVAASMQVSAANHRQGEHPHLLVFEGKPTSLQRRTRLHLLQIATRGGWFVFFTDAPHALLKSELYSYDGVVLSDLSMADLPVATQRLLSAYGEQRPVVHLRGPSTEAQLERFLRVMLHERLQAGV